MNATVSDAGVTPITKLRMRRRKMSSYEQCHKRPQQIVSELLKENSGQDLVEYALVICFIALGLVAAMSNFAGTIRTVLGSVGTKLTGFV